MLKTRKRLDNLETNIERLERSVDDLRSYVYTDGFKSKIAYALQEILDTNQAITIKHYLNDKEITTKLVKDELRELEQRQSDLEWALKATKDALKKYGK